MLWETIHSLWVWSVGSHILDWRGSTFPPSLSSAPRPCVLPLKCGEALDKPTPTPPPLLSWWCPWEWSRQPLVTLGLGPVKVGKGRSKGGRWTKGGLIAPAGVLRSLGLSPWCDSWLHGRRWGEQGVEGGQFKSALIQTLRKWNRGNCAERKIWREGDRGRERKKGGRWPK